MVFQACCVSRCKQTAGEKTIKITVYRPASLTEFGGEWVKLYEKDSWGNVTHEYAALQKHDWDPHGAESRSLPTESPRLCLRRSVTACSRCFGLRLHTYTRCLRLLCYLV